MSENRVHARLLARDARKRGDLEALLDLLAGTDKGGRRSAVYELGELRDARAVGPLIRCLQANDQLMRVGAIKGLAKIADPIAASDLYGVAAGDGSVGVRMEAAFALGLLNDHRGAELICSMIWEENNPYGRRYRRWAARRLVELRAVEAVSQLEKAKHGAGLIGRWYLRRAIKALKRRPVLERTSASTRG
jgi:hypothetical protein